MELEKKTKSSSKKKKSTRMQRMFWIVFITAAVAAFCAMATYAFIIINGNRMLTNNVNKLEMLEASIIYDKDGNEASKLFVENRESVTYDELPVLVREAFIATEDKRFEEHEGIDYFAIGRALVKDVIQRSAVEGGSTITQQLARNLFLTQEKTLFRKATEMSIAIAIEGDYTKDQIL